MLEVVCVKLAAVNYVVGLNIIGVLLDVKSDFLLCENVLDNRENLCMRCRRSCDGYFFALECCVINGIIKSVGGFFYDAYNRAVILFFNKVRYLLAFERCF